MSVGGTYYVFDSTANANFYLHSKDPQFHRESVDSLGGHKIQSDENVTKPTMKRNKRRQQQFRQQGDDLGMIVAVNGVQNSEESLDILQKDKCKDAVEVLQPHLSTASTSSFNRMTPLVKATSSSSYAAVVSGRSNFDLCDPEGAYSLERFVPMTGNSEMREHNDTCTTAFGNGSIASPSTRDVGTQVDFATNLSQKETQSISCHPSTMTSKKGKFRNKYVSVKLCCQDGYSASNPSAVEFLGDLFTFENAIEKSAANLGIKFADWGEDEIPMLFRNKN